MDAKEKVLVVIVLVSLLVLYAYQTQAQKRPDPAAGKIVVQRVIDGDTITILVQKKEQRVRFIGINAPEWKTHDCYSEEATIALRGLIQGKVVTLQDDNHRNKDEYGRYLRYVSLQGMDVNAWLVQQGFARVITFFPFAKLESYQKMEREAQENNRGLWSNCPNVEVS